MAYDLSILIPSRNEMFLAKTVEELLKNKRGNTEIIVGLDGSWADPVVAEHPDVTVLHYSKSLGQRAMTNQLCRLSKAKYVMKIDAHCTVDEGFDVKLMADMQDDWTVVPAMYNLHAFDWQCGKCGNRWYQGPTPTYCLSSDLTKNQNCDSTEFKRVLVFKRRENRKSLFYRFDKNLHFQYFGEYGRRPEAQGDLADTLSLQGSCFMMTRAKYWELDICEEAHGSWGQQGVEVACKTWLSGGRVVVNKKTWYAHMFRTQGGDFGFPYPLSGSDVEKARQYSRSLFLQGNWPLAKHDLNWLLEKFRPVPDWHDGQPVAPSKKGIIFYTDNQLSLKIAHPVQKQLKKSGLPIVSASLKPMTFGQNICLPLERGYLTMARQILAALEASKSEIIFFCEHDVLYHPSHFDFTPPSKDVYYYNTNVWRVRSSDGHALYCDNLQQLSGLCGYRETLIAHYKKRVELLEQSFQNIELCPCTDGNDWGQEHFEEEYKRYVRVLGFEPGTHNRPERIDDLKAESYSSEYPNIDIRHDSNLTPSRWDKDQFRNEKYTKGWKEADTVLPWFWEPGKFMEFLKSL